jgi:hypothetical protein
LILLALAIPAQAHGPGYIGSPAPNLNGTWYLNGNPSAPCEIRQGRPDQALFINEHGSQAWGTVYPDRVWIPDWSDGQSQGLRGTLEGNRIVWPTGSFWSR